MARLDDDYCPVTGGGDLPQSRVRGDFRTLSEKAPADLERHILQLLALHPSLNARYGNLDVAGLDEPTKLSLLAEMNEAIGVRPLRDPSKSLSNG